MNDIYDVARVQLLTGQLDWRSVPLVLSAWGGTPTFTPFHQSIADIVAAGFVEMGSSMDIVDQTVSSDGTAQTGPVLIPDVAAGEMVTWFTMSWKNTTHNLSSLILFIDEAEGLPFDSNDLDIVVQPDWLKERGWWRP